MRLAWANADDLDLLVHLDHATLDTSRDNGAATGDREDILDRHQERHVDLALGSGDVLIDRTHELHDRVGPLLVSLESWEGSNADHRDVVSGEFVAAEELANLHLD